MQTKNEPKSCAKSGHVFLSHGHLSTKKGIRRKCYRCGAVDPKPKRER